MNEQQNSTAPAALKNLRLLYAELNAGSEHGLLGHVLEAMIQS